MLLVYLKDLTGDVLHKCQFLPFTSLTVAEIPWKGL